MNTYQRISATILAAGMVLMPMPALAKEASIGKPSKLYDEPFRDAAVLENLSAASTVVVLERKGGWSRIQHKQKEGWVRTLDLRFGKAADGSVVADTFGLATGRSGSGNVVATTGIRGLDEEDLKSADFSAEQISLAESYRIEAADAQDAAASAGLQTSKLEYFSDTEQDSTAARRKDR